MKVDSPRPIVKQPLLSAALKAKETICKIDEYNYSNTIAARKSTEVVEVDLEEVPDHLVKVNQPTTVDVGDEDSINPGDVFDPFIEQPPTKKLLAAALKAKKQHVKISGKPFEPCHKDVPYCNKKSYYDDESYESLSEIDTSSEIQDDGDSDSSFVYRSQQLYDDDKEEDEEDEEIDEDDEAAELNSLFLASSLRAISYMESSTIEQVTLRSQDYI